MTIFDYAMGNRNAYVNALVEYEMKFISLEDTIELAKRQLKSDLDDMSTEKVMEKHAMVFNR